MAFTRHRTFQSVEQNHAATSKNSMSEFQTGTHCEHDIIASNDIGSELLRTYWGYDPQSALQQTETSLLSVARADTWIASIVKLTSETKSKGSALQKSYQELYELCLPNAIRQLQFRIYIVAIRLYHETFAVIALDLTGGIKSSQAFQDVIKVFKSSSGRHLLCIRDTWILRNISRQIGLIKDCVVAETEPNGSPFAFYTHISENSTHTGINLSQTGTNEAGPGSCMVIPDTQEEACIGNNVGM